mgnify:CR=1 FL=1
MTGVQTCALPILGAEISDGTDGTAAGATNTAGQTAANTTIDTIASAIDYVGSVRSSLGAAANRLDGGDGDDSLDGGAGSDTIDGGAGGDDVVFQDESYVSPPAAYHYVAATGEVKQTALRMTSIADYSDCDVERQYAISKDGTRVPLNIIKLGLGRIKTLEDLENYKAVAKEEIDHAIEIADETLTISDVNKPIERVFVGVNINEVVNRCLRLVDRSRYQVTLDLQNVPPVRGIFSDLQVVVTNLIHNAMEAMPEGGSISFTTLTLGGTVMMKIEDTGEGIPLESRSRVWEPYFSGKGGSAVGNANAGRGWGLTIVKIGRAHV